MKEAQKSLLGVLRAEVVAVGGSLEKRPIACSPYPLLLQTLLGSWRWNCSGGHESIHKEVDFLFWIILAFMLGTEEWEV